MFISNEFQLVICILNITLYWYKVTSLSEQIQTVSSELWRKLLQKFSIELKADKLYIETIDYSKTAINLNCPV